MRLEEFRTLIKKLEAISEGEIVKGPWQEKPPVTVIDDEPDYDTEDSLSDIHFPRGKEYQALTRLGVQFMDAPGEFHSLMSSSRQLAGDSALWHIQKALGRRLKTYILTDVLEDYQDSPYPTMKYKKKPAEETFVLRVDSNISIHDIFQIPAGTRFLCNSHPSMNFIVSWATIG